MSKHPNTRHLTDSFFKSLINYEKLYHPQWQRFEQTKKFQNNQLIVAIANKPITISHQSEPQTVNIAESTHAKSWHECERKIHMPLKFERFSAALIYNHNLTVVLLTQHNGGFQSKLFLGTIKLYIYIGWNQTNLSENWIKIDGLKCSILRRSIIDKLLSRKPDLCNRGTPFLHTINAFELSTGV